MKKKKPAPVVEFSKEIPEILFEQIGEHSYGGFMLFYFDLDGAPRCHTIFSEVADSIALRKFALDFLEAADKAAREQLLHRFLGNNC